MIHSGLLIAWAIMSGACITPTCALKGMRALETATPSPFPQSTPPSVAPTSFATTITTTFPTLPRSEPPTIVATTSSSNGNTVAYSFSLLLPILAATCIAYILKTNSKARDKVRECFTGEFCALGESNVPEQIIVTQPSVVGDKATDVELMPVSTFENIAEPLSPLPPPTRQTQWNTLPPDPVDEVSLKGSSFYCSSEEEDNDEEPTTHFVRLPDPPES